MGRDLVMDIQCACMGAKKKTLDAGLCPPVAFDAILVFTYVLYHI